MKYFLPLLCVTLNPLLTSLQNHYRFFECPIGVILFYTILVLIFSLILNYVSKKIPRWKQTLDRGVVLFWIFASLFHFITHIGLPGDLFHHKKWVFIGSLLVTLVAAKMIKDQGQAIQRASVLSVFLILGMLISVKNILVINRAPMPELKTATKTSTVHIVLDMFASEQLRKYPAVMKKINELNQKWGLTFYDNHHAVYSETYFSVPQFLGQEIKSEEKVELLAERENIFHKLKSQGLQIYLWGESIPYCRYFGKLTQYCRTRPQKNVFLNELFDSSVLVISQFSEKILHAIWHKSIVPIIMENPLSSLELFKDFIDVYEKRDSNLPAYFYVHLLVPHPPFFLDQDCKTLSKFDEDKSLKFTSEQGQRYEGQALCSLKLMDQMMEVFQKSKHPWPRIVIHSDHGQTAVKTVEEYKHGLTTQEIKEAAQIWAWTKKEKNSTPQTITSVTSNLDIPAFVLQEVDQFKTPSNVPFYYYQFWDKNFGEFRSTDGTSWEKSP